MKAEVYFRRLRGQRVSEREQSSKPPLLGHLTYATVTYGTCPVRVLSLHENGNNTSMSTTAQLFEPEMIGLAHGWIVFRGYEAIPGEGGPISFLQEWRCRLIV
jgi:hypothetical protein